MRLRSYVIPGELDDFAPTILEAAHATSATASYFEPGTIRGLKFVDGALGANNSVDEVWSETLNIWCPNDDVLEPLVQYFVSIGTSKPGLKPLNESLRKFHSKTLKETVVETERTASSVGTETFLNANDTTGLSLTKAYRILD